MSEFFVYDSDNSCNEFSIQSTESKKGDDTDEDTAPKRVSMTTYLNCQFLIIAALVVS